MGAHNVLNEIYAVAAPDMGTANDPGAGGTMEVNGQSGKVFVITTTAVDSVRVLPPSDSVKIGTVLYVVNAGTDTASIQKRATAGGSLSGLTTLTPGSAKIFILGGDVSLPSWKYAAFS